MLVLAKHYGSTEGGAGLFHQLRHQVAHGGRTKEDDKVPGLPVFATRGGV